MIPQCPICGAYLDPGEKCDCKKEEAAPEEATPTSNLSLSLLTGNVNLKEFRIANNIKQQDIADTLNAAGYTKADKQIVSKVENPAYGVTFLPGAWDALRKRYNGPSKRRNPKRLQLVVRLPKTIHAAVLLAREGMTTQDWLADIVIQELQRRQLL